MSRAGYSEELDNWDLIRWRGQVKSAIRGKRGQALLRDMLAALDAMPDKRLISGELVDANGEVCALGCLGQARGMDLAGIDPEDYGQVAVAFNIAEQLAREIEYQNDERHLTPEQRFESMRRWVAAQIKSTRALSEREGEG